MENSPSRPTYSSQPKSHASQESNMSTLTMPTPLPHPLFRNEGHWDTPLPYVDYSRPRTENRPIALPSIRQTFPDLHLDGSLADGPRSRSFPHVSPASAAGPSSGFIASPDYVHSPNSTKRRRMSMEDEQAGMRGQLPSVPRLYRSPERPLTRPLSSPRRGYPQTTTAESWMSPSRPTPFVSSTGALAPMDVDSRVDGRTSLPGLAITVPKLDPKSSTIHGRREASHGSTITAAGAQGLDRQPTYRGPEYEYSYHHHHPNRYQSLSTSSIRPHDTPPFSAGSHYHPHYQDISRQGEAGSDAKQRKRRGNLPKETTDKHRAWFLAHLQHPYPTEDEKQELMRQTALQMNQISNWFINARRRQLPAMINNARAETEMMNSRQGGEGEMLTPTERSVDYGAVGGKRGDVLTMSDGECYAYDEDMRGLRKRRTGDASRESV